MHRLFTAAVAAAALFSAFALPAAAAQLTPLPKPAESFDSGSLHVDRYGSGAHSIVIIPGLSCGPWTFGEQIAHFSPMYSVYAITLAGFDGRPAVKDSASFSRFSDDFTAMLAAHHIVKPVVIGHSLGGTLSLYLGEHHSDLLAGIIATDGLPVFPTVAMATPAQRQAVAAQAAAFATMTPEQQEKYELQFMQTIGTADASLAPAMAKLAVKSDGAAVGAWIKEDISSDLRPELKNITVPVMEVMPYDAKSEQGKQYSQEQTLGFYRMLLTGTPKLEVTPIPDARHFAMIDQSAAYDAAVTQFLQHVWP